jgi:hypothetical protein
MKTEPTNAPNATAAPAEETAGPRVAVLCVTPRSHYKKIPGCDCYDARRDAWTYRGGLPVVAHPPCRSWGRLRAFVRDDCEGERALAAWCVAQVQTWGGVLEHPVASRLFAACRLPGPGARGRDAHGGYTIKFWQGMCGHLLQKNTLLYIVGIEPGCLPAMPFQLLGGSGRDFESLSGNQRKATPPAFSAWLVEVARRCGAARKAKEVLA